MPETKYQVMSAEVDENNQISLPDDAFPLNAMYNPQTMKLTVVALIDVHDIDKQNTKNSGSKDSDDEDSDDKDSDDEDSDDEDSDDKDSDDKDSDDSSLNSKRSKQDLPGMPGSVIINDRKTLEREDN